MALSQSALSELLDAMRAGATSMAIGHDEHPRLAGGQFRMPRRITEAASLALTRWRSPASGPSRGAQPKEACLRAQRRSKGPDAVPLDLLGIRAGGEGRV